MRRILLGGCALIILGVLAVMYVAYRNSLTDDRDQTSGSSEVVSAEHKEDSETATVTDSFPASNSVPVTQPRTMSIPSIGIAKAPIIPVGIASNGEMATPSTNHEIGWYKSGALPNQEKGAIVFNGHVGIGDRPAVFKDLHRLSTGGIIEIRTGDNSSYRYQVYHIERLPLEKVDMRKMLRSADPSKQGLNIITCAGEYDPARKTYDDRVLVYAVRI